ncbi:MAG: hypothetical protein AB1896_22490, partial [Thermodesulfobacteriota bacterium]
APDKEVVALNQAISASGTTFTLAGLGLQILVEYHVGVTVLGTSAAYAVVDQASNQFTVRLFNSAGNSTSGTVNIEVRGF